MRVLVIEDDQETADFICSSLKKLGNVAQHQSDGKQGFLSALDDDFDVMVIDRMLPELDGMSLVRAVRSANVQTPILFLSAMAGLTDRVDGLQAGADDYLTKPFSFSELSARLTALARRPPIAVEETKLQVGDLEVDLLRQVATRAGIDIVLQPRELRLLCFLMRNSDRVLTRTMLLEGVWDFHFDPHTNVVETQISRLRNKVDKPFDYPLIHTIRGIGYSLHA